MWLIWYLLIQSSHVLWFFLIYTFCCYRNHVYIWPSDRSDSVILKTASIIVPEPSFGISKYSDTQNICCNHSKIWTMWLYHRVMIPNDADGMANSVDPNQIAPVWSGSAPFAQANLSENLGSLRYFMKWKNSMNKARNSYAHMRMCVRIRQNQNSKIYKALIHMHEYECFCTS